jgi:uncharacterized protein YndB with AHSA1/START domain
MTVVVSKEISASPDAVWALVSDLTRMGEWSPENQGGEWVKGATGPAVGAQFKGRNSNGKRSWSTTVKVVEFDPPRKFSFSLMVGRSAWCDWVWEVAPSGHGTLVTHSWVDRRSKFANWLGGKVSGVTDRAGHNRANMERTLEALANSLT